MLLLRLLSCSFSVYKRTVFTFYVCKEVQFWLWQERTKRKFKINHCPISWLKDKEPVCSTKQAIIPKNTQCHNRFTHRSFVQLFALHYVVAYSVHTYFSGFVCLSHRETHICSFCPRCTCTLFKGFVQAFKPISSCENSVVWGGGLAAPHLKKQAPSRYSEKGICVITALHIAYEVKLLSMCNIINSSGLTILH